MREKWSGKMKKRKGLTLDQVRRELLAIEGTSELIEEERANLQAAELIRDARKAANLSQAALAAKLHVEQSRISQMESGRGKYGPSVVLLERVARACGGTLRLAFERSR
jgi:ribosome-binding protein aMBF1 (putative translation factor)